MEYEIMWVKFKKIFKQNVLFTLIDHEYRIGFKAKLQIIWLYFTLFYSILMIIVTKNIEALSSTFSFFINFGTIIAFVPASSSISGEIGGIADNLLSKSVRRWQYILSKHLSQILLTLTIYVLINGLSLGILAIMKAFATNFDFGQFFILFGFNALVLVFFSTLGVFLSSIYSKPIFPILGCFFAWFMLIFLFILIPTIDFNLSPVLFNSKFNSIISDTWLVKYWKFFVIYGSSSLLLILGSIFIFYYKDF